MLKFLLLAIAVSTLWFACSKDKTSTTPVKVRLTDAPGNFQEVNINVTGVEFNMEDGAVVNMNVVTGKFNLLNYVNGTDLLIASTDVKSGKLSQVRLILGTDNSVKVGGIVYPLTTPSADQSGLKINVHSTLTEGVLYELLLDFDASQSIVLTGNGEYKLKPVIRAVSVATTGSISGKVTTALALPALVSATDGTNVYTTMTDVNGNFLLRGIPAGTYVVTITPTLPYLVKTVANVNVTNGNSTPLVAILF